MKNLTFKSFNVKKFFYRAYLTLLALIAVYAVLGIAYFKWMHVSAENPRGAFLTVQATQNPERAVTISEFLDYGCPFCKQLHPTVKEFLNLRKDINYIARPIAFNEQSEFMTRHVLAAGLQGKFWQMHNAVLEHPDTELPEGFFEETASVFGLDMEQFNADINSREVDKILRDNINAWEHAGAQVTPSFLMGAKIYQPGESLPTLVELINMVNEAK